MAKLKIIIEVEVETNLDNYVDPVANDYPYTEQIADEIINNLAEDGSAWAEELSEGKVTVTIIND